MDNKIINLIKLLKKKGRNDLANLLIGCESEIEETDQYGSYWNQFLSSFTILVPKVNYQKFQRLSENDRGIIFQALLELYPKNEDLEIGFMNFKLLPNEDMLNENRVLAESWLKRAKNKLDEGRQSLDKWRYAEAVSSFQECIEFSIKSISLLLLDKYSKDHKFDEKEFKEILDNIPDTLQNLEFHKLYLYSKFWGNFYTIAKYGLENFGIGAEKLFEKEEVELAQKHADKCYSAAYQLKNYLENPW